MYLVDRILQILNGLTIHIGLTICIGFVTCEPCPVGFVFKSASERDVLVVILVMGDSGIGFFHWECLRNSPIGNCIADLQTQYHR